MQTTIQAPFTTVSIVNTNIITKNTPQKILFVGQKNGGTVTEKTLIESIPNDGSEDTLFGADSMLATLIRANKVRNKQVQVDAIALDEPSISVSVTSINRTLQIATVITASDHGFITGATVTIIGADDDLYNLTATITVTDSTTFDYTIIGMPITPAESATGITAEAESGSKATGSITLTGANAVAGSLTIIVGSERNHKFDVAVAKDADATAIAVSIAAAINADSRVPVDVGEAAGVVTLTAVNAGTYGNTIPLEVRGTVSNITVTLSKMAGGSTDPSFADIFNVVAERRYQAVVWPYPTDTGLAAVLGFLDPRLNVAGDILDGVAFTALTDTLDGLTDSMAVLDAINSQSLLVIGDKQEDTTTYSGGSIVEIPMVKAAQTAGFRGLRLDSSGFSISDIVVTSSGPLDAFGGKALASKPYFNMPYPDLAPIVTGRGFSRSEIETLRKAGISVLGNNRSNNGVVSGELVTTYLNDPQGNPDVTFTFLNFVDSSSQIREFIQENLIKRFSQSRLTLGDVTFGRDMANAQTIRTFLKRLYQELAADVLVERGDTAFKFFDDNLVITLDLAEGKATVTMIVQIVTQLRILNVTMQVAFATSG